MSFRFGELIGWRIEREAHAERSPRASFLAILRKVQEGDREGARRILAHRIPWLGPREYCERDHPLALHLAYHVLDTYAELLGGAWPKALAEAWLAFADDLQERLNEAELEEQAEEEEHPTPTGEDRRVEVDVEAADRELEIAHLDMDERPLSERLEDQHEEIDPMTLPDSLFEALVADTDRAIFGICVLCRRTTTGRARKALHEGRAYYAHADCARAELKRRASESKAKGVAERGDEVGPDAEELLSVEDLLANPSAWKIAKGMRSKKPYQARHKGDDPGCALCLRPIHKGTLARKRFGADDKAHDDCFRKVEALHNTAN